MTKDVNKSLHNARCKVIRFNIYADDFCLSDDVLKFIGGVCIYAVMTALIVNYFFSGEL